MVLFTSGWLAAEASRARENMSLRWSLVGVSALSLAFALVELVIFPSVTMLLVWQRPDHARVSAVTTVWHVIGMAWLVIFPVV